MKKRILSGIFVIVSLSIIFIAALTSAAQFNIQDAQLQIQNGLTGVINVLTPFLQPIIGDYSTSEFFFSKVLLLILLIIIIKNVLDRTPIGSNNKKVSILISLIISILSIRFISQNNLIQEILIQYGVIGIAITTILPLIIFFYFIHNIKIRTSGRRIFWIIYAITLCAIWISKFEQISSIGNWIYSVGLLAIIAFIIFDRKIHGHLDMEDFKEYQNQLNKKTIRNERKELTEIEDHFKNERMTFEEYKKEKKHITDHIKELSKED